MVKSLRGFETIFIILLLSGVSLFALAQTNIRPKFNFYSSSLPASLPSPTPAPVTISSIQEEKTLSPDGKVTLIMEKQQIGQEIKYSLSALRAEDNVKTFIFSKNINKNQEITTPFNTFSPDNRHVFLKESDSYIVWPISQDAQTEVNISSLFLERLPDLTLSEITGWAAPDLLIVNIENSEGVKSSYWFEVSSQNFIQLATGFY